MQVKKIIIYDKKDNRNIRIYKPLRFERYTAFKRRVESDLRNRGITEYYGEMEFYD